ncbi:MAG: 3-oxoacyl-ACP synthase [Aquaticitalea sp.]
MLLNNKLFVSTFCHIKNNTISLNGTPLFSNDVEQFSSFIKSAANHLNTDYPKFFKMDNLSKLAFLAADVLLKDQQEKSQDIAILLSNRASSLDTDRKYQASISAKENYYPSPSVFVYTLPNICIGEISIKHQLHSESGFFVSQQFDPEPLHLNSDYLLKNDKAEKVLCGWVDFDDNNYEAFLYLVSENGKFAHSPNVISRLYHVK